MKYFCGSLGKSVACLLLLLVGAHVHAQETIVTYVKKNGSYTIHKDSAEYTRVLRILPNEEGLYELNEYYTNGNLKRHGWVKDTKPHPLRFEGLVESYYDNELLESSVRYADDQRIDTADKYYRNGVLREREVYLRRTKEQLKSRRLDNYKRLLYYADSLGNVQVEEGNGSVVITANEIDAERGHYVNGLRDGHWTGTFRKGKYRFEEWYSDGVLTYGITTDSLGGQYAYEQREISPEYPGGQDSFRRFIGQNYQYPREAIQAKVHGNVLISFVVDTTGMPLEFDVLNDPGYGTVEAGIEVVKKSGRWIPGYQRGVPVRVKYTLPIRLNLAAQPPPESSSP